MVGCLMSWSRVEGRWKQRRGRAEHDWGKMMKDDLATVSGRYEELVGMLQEKYGIVNEEAKRQAQSFKTRCIDCRRATREQLEKSRSELMEIRKKLTGQKKTGKHSSAAKRPAMKRPRSKENG